MNLDGASIQFVGFGLLTAVLINLSRSSAWRFSVLFAASVLFVVLLAQGPLSLLPLAGFLLFGYLCLVLIRRGVPRAMMCSVLVVILVYMWLKKYTLFPEAIFLTYPYLTIGLSYIFFRVLHLLIESGDEEYPHVGIGAYLLYTLNFTTFVSGPIQRFDEFRREIAPLDAGIVGEQLERIVIGFFKVNIVAMLLHGVQQNALADLSPVATTPRLLAGFSLAVVYPFFLYANFSGYIDIAIALARLMRLELPENFNRPFSAASFLDFWNRWHITLSSWLKTYVYNSLLTTLMRRISNSAFHPYLGVFCFFVTFFLVGIWHGRTSEFVVFGLLQGGGVAINKLWQVQLARRIGNKGYRALTKNPLYVAFGRGLTFAWFAFTLFWFWASWAEIHAAFGALPFASWLLIWSGIWMAATLALGAWEWLRSKILAINAGGAPLVRHRYVRVAYASALALVGFTIAVLLNQSAPDIVYKAF
jgi:alginate O-acetyltransferase complex protein AlgI